jgi:hypothetical protein
MSNNVINEPLFAIMIEDLNASIPFIAPQNVFTTSFVHSINWKKGDLGDGILSITVDEFHPILAYAYLDSSVIFTISQTFIRPLFTTPVPASFQGGQRRTPFSFSQVFGGIFRDLQITTDANGVIYHNLIIVGLSDILRRYVSGWPAGVVKRSKYIGRSYDAILADFFAQNVGISANNPFGGTQRIRPITVIRNLSVSGTIFPPDSTPITTWVVEPGRNVAEVGREFGDLGYADYSIFPVASLAYELRAFRHDEIIDDSVARDLRDSVYLSQHLDNVKKISLNRNRIGEKTVMIVGGQGDGATRTFAIVTGENFAANNDYEVFVNASGTDDDSLAAAGEIEARRRATKALVQAEHGNSLGWWFHREYSWYDIVTVEIANEFLVRRVRSFEGSYDQTQRPRIILDLAVPPPHLL